MTRNPITHPAVRAPLGPRSALCVALLCLAGCAGMREHSEGMDLVAKGQNAQGLALLRQAVKLDPRNAQYRIDLLSQTHDIVGTSLQRAQDLAVRGRIDEAAAAYEDVLAIEPDNDRARMGLDKLLRARRAEAQLQSAERLLKAGKNEQALEAAQQVLHEMPDHAHALQLRRDVEDKIEAARVAREEQLAARSAFRRPVSLSLRDTPLKVIFEALSRVGGINIVIDRDVKTDVKSTIFVKDAPFEDTIDVLLIQNQLEKRVLNGNSLLIFPAIAAKQKELTELKVRSFQLSNIDASIMANIIKTMLKTKDIVADPKLNLLVMRDSAEAIALAERLVAANDVPEAEVELELNVMEVSSNRASDLGLKFPTAVTLSTPLGLNGGSLTAGELRDLSRGQLLVSPMSITLNLMLKDSETKLLARPHIRAKNKEKAKILVGDRLPQITNLLSPQQAGQSTVLTGSIQYIDVGIKLEVEPEIHTDGDVTIKLLLEVSNVTDVVQTESGRAYQLGTRSAQTSLRLHDGETQILGGLITDNDRASAQKLPGLGQLPLLGRAFSDHSGDRSAAEIVVSITPRIVRPRAAPELRNSDAYSGSETSIRDRALRLDSIGGLRVDTPASKPGAATPTPQPGAVSGTTAQPPAAAAAAAAAAASAPAGVPTVVPRVDPNRTPRVQPPAEAPHAPVAPAAPAASAPSGAASSAQ